MAIAAGAFMFLLVVGTALGSGLFTGQYEPENWTLSVPGAPVSPASGPTDEVTFSYNAAGLIRNQWRDYWFHNTADQTSAIEFDWQFSSCHSWFHSQARAYAWRTIQLAKPTPDWFSPEVVCSMAAGRPR